MRTPLSWLKEFVEITLGPQKLAQRLTEVGLGVESIAKANGDIIFELEVTPNRPDLLSIIGIAREIAAIEAKKVRTRSYEITTPEKVTLPMKIETNYELFLRWTAVAIANVSLKPSPPWMQERLTKVGLRPINNVVDITNYVMFELGMPLHAFDYDQIKGQQMVVERAKGGERFTTVDELTYSLPKDAIIIRDKDRLIDLAGIKGGLNSGVTDKTRNVFLHVTIDDPVLIRRASQTLGVRSEASAIYERGPDSGGTVNALKRAASLITELAGGKVASDVIDLKKDSFAPWTVSLSHDRLIKVLGIDLAPKVVTTLLARLGLATTIQDRRIYAVTIPTHRNDLRIEEDLIEEVARLYGYNNFSKTLPKGEVPTEKVPYAKDYQTEERAKHVLTAAGFSEIFTYSLVSEQDLTGIGVNPQKCLRVDNPVSREYEYLRPSLKASLVKALAQNLPYAKDICLFELGKVYRGKSIDEPEEVYFLSGIANKLSFYEVKGVLERLLKELGVREDPTATMEILPEGVFFELNFTELITKVNPQKKFVPLPKYPPIVEDLAILASPRHPTGNIIEAIKRTSPLVTSVSLLDQYETTRTFHIIYQHRKRNLTASDAAKIRKKIVKELRDKFNAKLKE